MTRPPTALLSGLVGLTLLAGAVPVPASAATPAASTPATQAAAAGVSHQQNDRVPAGSVWTQHYFPSSDDSDTELHADVLLPADLAAGEQVPVILSVGPYFSHGGQDVRLDPPPPAGPSPRFDDLIEGADLFERGYALVMVDSRGFGGSSGCLDFAGPREQADVKAAIEWTAAQPWSTGVVGMYGKSADASTGLLGNNLDLPELGAVVAQEPVWDLYRNTHSNGIPRTTSGIVPTSYNQIAQIPALPDDDPRYAANARYEQDHPECLVQNSAGYRITDPRSEHWTDRDMAARAEGTDTPLLFTQGYLEWNTEAEGMDEFLAGHHGPQRGWIGPWGHVRGNERLEDGRLQMGREGWFDEVMSFYDQYLKGVEPTVTDPAFAVQDSLGRWRAQDTWPVVERGARIGLGSGRYVDDGQPAAGRNAYVVRSHPVARDTRVTGTPSVRLTTQGRGNVHVRLHDVAPDGTSVVFDEQVSVLRRDSTVVALRSTDWTLPAGHVLAIEIGTVQPETDDLVRLVWPGDDWLDTPSGGRVQVTSAQLDLALDDPADDVGTQGAPAPYLEAYRAVRSDALPDGEATFTLPAVTRG